jgi:hypothetical protein
MDYDGGLTLSVWTKLCNVSWCIQHEGAYILVWDKIYGYREDSLDIKWTSCAK